MPPEPADPDRADPDPAGASTPSWVSPPVRPASGTERDRQPVPVTLYAAVVLTAALAVAQTVHVLGRDELVVGLRVFLVGVVDLQVLLAVGAARRSAGAALGLLVCQLTTGLASLTGGFGEQRLAFAAGSALVIALVAASFGAFPSAPLPPIEHRTIDPGGRR